MDVIEITGGYLTIKDDVFHLKVEPDIEITKELAKEGLDVRIKIQKGKPMLSLVNATEMLNMGNETRSFIAAYEKEHNLNIALAIISTSLVTNMVANFFIKFNKPHAPTKIFRTEEEALTWLDTFR